MSRYADLMPMSCRLTLGRREHIRRWTVIYCGALAVLLGGAWLLYDAQESRRARRDALAQQARERWERNEEAQRLLKETRELEDAISRYTRLAWPVRVCDAIDAIGTVLPADCALTTLAVTPREENRRGRSARSEGGESGPRSVLVIEMEGIAPGDADAAAFVSGLADHRLFSRVALEYARGTKVRGLDARAFRVSCEVNLSERFVFTDAEGREEATP